MSATSPTTTVSAILEAVTGATDTSPESTNSIEGGLKAVVRTSATATVSAVSAAATDTETVDSINDGANAVVQSSASTSVVNSTTTSANDALAAAETSTSSPASVKDTSSTDVTSTTGKTSSPSSSSSTSDSAATTSTSTTLSSSQNTSTSTSATSTSSSASSSSTLTSAPQSTETTAGPSSTTSPQTLSTILYTSTNSEGQTVTSTSYVVSSSSVPNQTDSLSTTTPGAFFKNKAAVGGVFGAVGLISLILLLAVVLKIVRYRANRKFERELNEQVDNEIRSGSPMFGFGKEDDGMSVRGMGMGTGMMDPEKAAYAGVGSYTSGNTAAYAYGDRAPQAALQPAYYSPNAFGGAPRRPSLGHSRTGSQGSNRSYGSLAGTPMNPFAPATFAVPPATFASPGYNYNNGPNHNYAIASPAPPANYGEYRGPSPAPSTQSYQSFGARPGTPTALTPGGGRGSPAPGVTVPRGVYDPRTPSPGIIGSGIGVRPESPAVPLQYSRSSRGSREYVPSGLGRQPTQTLGVPAGNLSRGNSVNSIKAPLPNPFDERDP